jgi:UDP-2,3-diacylglucosamine hydrolase
MNTLFISDLHLTPERPALSELFMDFIRVCAGRVQQLYILGDLFEAWLGDDAGDDTSDAIGRALRHLHDQGTDIAIMHGNRDFLLGPDFASEAGSRLIEDPLRIELDGNAVLLSHGDVLCTDDSDYQRFRRQVRDPAFQRRFLSLSVAERREQARAYRDLSQQATSMKAEDIMDVNDEAVSHFMREHNADYLIHGHTHRPAVHAATPDHGQRIVLGDWGHCGSVLIHNRLGFVLHSFEATTLDTVSELLD